jgi:hypothetical protein
MKKVLRNNRLIAVAFLTFFTGTAAFASDTTRHHIVSGAELKFAGTYRNNPVFELIVTNDREEDTYTISITDMFGNLFYQDRLSARNFSKKFMLKTEDLVDDKLIFKIYSRNLNKTTLYEIGSRSYSVNEGFVTRL